MVIRQPLHVPAPLGAPNGRRKKLSTASTIAIAGSAAVHLVIGVYLYNMAFKPMAEPIDSEPVVIGDILHINQDKPKPQEPAPVKTPRTVLHQPTLKGALPDDTFRADPLPPINVVETGKSPLSDETIEVKSDPPPPPPKRITNPEWLRQPDGALMTRFYPDRAIRMGLGGAATISCVVSASGTLGQCHVVRESPADLGFGEAALKLSQYFRMKPRTEDNQPVGGATVQIPIKFQPGA